MEDIGALKGRAGKIDQLNSLSETIDTALEISTFGQHGLDPTPVAPFGMRIVEEIELGSIRNHDEAGTELIKWLFIPREDVQELDFSSHEHPAVATACCSFNSREASNQGRQKNTAYITCQKPDTWDERFQELVKYRTEHGNCLVPHNWKGNRPLAQWEKRQRYQAKLRKEGRHTTLTYQREKALEDIGFVWSSHGAGWDEKFHALEAFAKRYGHCNVPSKYPPNPQLSVWVRCQRRHFKLLRQRNQVNQLTLRRCSKWQSLGFDFNPRNKIST